MCWRCACYYDPESWDMLRYKWNRSPVAGKGYPLNREEMLPQTDGTERTGQFLAWEVLVAHNIHQLDYDALEVGAGIPSPDGNAMRDRDHFICKGDTLTWCRDSGGSNIRGSRKLQCYPDSIQVTYTANTREISFGHKSLRGMTKLDCITAGLFPIVALYTKVGIVNLLPTSQPPSLQDLCAHMTALRMHHPEDLDNEGVSGPCLTLVKKEWFRCHVAVIRVFGDDHQTHN